MGAPRAIAEAERVEPRVAEDAAAGERGCHGEFGGGVVCGEGGDEGACDERRREEYGEERWGDERDEEGA